MPTWIYISISLIWISHTVFLFYSFNKLANARSICRVLSKQQPDAPFTTLLAFWSWPIFTIIWFTYQIWG